MKKTHKTRRNSIFPPPLKGTSWQVVSDTAVGMTTHRSQANGVRAMLTKVLADVAVGVILETHGGIGGDSMILSEFGKVVFSFENCSKTAVAHFNNCQVAGGCKNVMTINDDFKTHASLGVIPDVVWVDPPWAARGTNALIQELVNSFTILGAHVFVKTKQPLATAQQKEAILNRTGKPSFFVNHFKPITGAVAVTPPPVITPPAAPASVAVPPSLTLSLPPPPPPSDDEESSSSEDEDEDVPPPPPGGRIMLAPSGSGKSHYCRNNPKGVVDGDIVLKDSWPAGEWWTGPDKAKHENMLYDLLCVHAAANPSLVVYTALRNIDDPYRHGVSLKVFLPKKADVESWVFSGRHKNQPKKPDILKKHGGWQSWISTHSIFLSKTLDWDSGAGEAEKLQEDGSPAGGPESGPTDEEEETGPLIHSPSEFVKRLQGVPIRCLTENFAKVCRGAGFLRTTIDEANSNAHRQSADLRELGARLLLSMAAKGRSVLFPYDHGRYAKLLSRVGSNRITGYTCGGRHAPKDHDRGSKPQLPEVGGEEYDYVVFHDVYLGGAELLDAERLAEYCATARYGQVFIIASPYFGTAGTSLNAAWVRTGDVVTAVYDASSQYTHPVLNWLFEHTSIRTSHGTLLIAESRHLAYPGLPGSKTIFTLSLTNRRIADVPRLIPGELLQIAPVEYLAGHYFLGSRHKPMFYHEIFALKVAAKRLGSSAYQERIYGEMLKTRLNKTDWFERFQAVMPKLSAEVMENSVTYLSSHLNHETRADLLVNLAETGRAKEDVKALRNIKEPSTWGLISHNLGRWMMRRPKSDPRSLLSTQRTTTGAWDAYVRAYTDNDFDACLGVRGISEEIDGLLPDWPSRDCVDPPPHDAGVNIFMTQGGQRVTRLPEPDIKYRMTPLLLTNGTLCAPSNGIDTLVQALRWRNAVKVPIGDPVVWKRMTRLFLAEFSDEDLEPDSVSDWLESISDTAKRERISKAYDLWHRGEVEHVAAMNIMAGRVVVPVKFQDRLKMFPKTNETLFPKQQGSTWTMKPRTILVVNDMSQIIAQPWIRAATRRLKRELSDKYFTLGPGKRVHLTYSGGLLDEDLSVWLHDSLDRVSQPERTASFIIMGDDSYGVYWDVKHKRPRYIEIDYSHFDQSQQDIQVCAETAVMEALGVPKNITDYLGVLSSQPASCAKRGMPSVTYTTKHKKRLTGSPHTSLANSINNMLAILILAENDYVEDQSVWDIIGFKAKIQYHDNYYDGTFLRGVWWPTKPYVPNVTAADGSRPTLFFKWAWMPSAVVKMGKILRKLTKKESVATMAYAMAMNIGTACDVPILSSFRDALLRAGKKNQDYVESENYRASMASRAIIDREMAIEIICRRYQFERADLLRAEKLLDSVRVLPAFVGDDVFEQLARVDYS